MDNHQFVQVTRTLVKRSLTDIERKLVAGAMSGGLAYAVLQTLAAYGITLPPNVAEVVPAVIGWLGAYAAHSLGSVTTVQQNTNGSTEVSTATGSIRIPQAFLPQPHPVPVAVAPDPNPGPVADPEPAVEPAPAAEPTVAINPGMASVTQILADPNAKYASASKFLGSLPSATDGTDQH
jgi:hypothetical protein